MWKFKLEETGYCTAKRSMLLRGAKSDTMRLYATFGILEHPQHGLILFDLGYHSDFYKYSKKWPYSIYARSTPVFHKPQESASERLKQLSYDPKSVKWIILSHFHADHVAGLVDFPEAQLICSEEAWDAVRNLRGFGAVRRAFIPALIPADFKSRLKLISFKGKEHLREHPILGVEYDLFGDASLMVSSLPGHAAGQIGIRFNTANQEVFLVADAAWLRSNYVDLHLPSPLVRVFFSSWRDFKTSLRKVQAYHQAFPDTAIIPCHCPETLKEWKP